MKSDDGNSCVFSSEKAMQVFLAVISAGEDCALTGSGNSMYPFLKDEHDIILMSSLQDKEISRGDIVLFQRDTGQYVIHRVYKCCSDNTFSFVGDNQYTVEKNITRSQMKAVAKVVIRNGKQINCRHGCIRLILTAYMMIRVNCYRFYKRILDFFDFQK